VATSGDLRWPKPGTSSWPRTERVARAKWLASELTRGTGHAARINKIIDVWRDHGFWIHRQGTLEDVLSITEKRAEKAVEAASVPGPIDIVAEWVSYKLDPGGEVKKLLDVEVERIAHGVLRALRLTPDARFDRPLGSTSESDSRLVSIAPIGDTGVHRLVVLAPEEFAGYWVDFDRSTSPDETNLKPPQ
jgi:hypothetical protein